MARRPHFDLRTARCQPSSRLGLLASLLSLAVIAGGCGPASDDDPASANGANGANGANVSTSQTVASSDGGAAASAAATTHDIWEAVLFDGQHVGYAHTAVRPEGHSGNLSVQYTFSLQLTRFGDATQPSMNVQSVQTAAGRLVSFNMSAALADQPTICRGRVENGRLVVQREGVEQPQEIPLDDDVLGFWGVEANLIRQPLKPGEARQLRALDPTLLAVMNYDLTAIGHQQVELLDGASHQLLRIDLVARLPGRLELQYRLWADEQGRILKRQSVGLGVDQTLIVTSQQRATGASGQYDLGSRSVVAVNRPIADAHARPQMRYRVRLKSGNPAQAFKSTRLQQVRPIDERTAEIVVTSANWQQLLSEEAQAAASSETGPQPPPAESYGDDKPTEADLLPGRLIASGHPQIVELAAKAASDKVTAAAAALALEQFVHRSIRQVNYKTVLGSAADVVERMEGDCTEHAVLLAAMARARGIPSRVAVGLVYVPGLQGFAFHMWTEVYVAGRWMPLDATLGQGGTGPAHLTLLTTNLADDASGDSLAALLPVAQVMGQLEIEVLD